MKQSLTALDINGVTSTEAMVARRPNVLLLLLDDMNDNLLSERPLVPMPAFRALGNRGATFVNAHAAGTSTRNAAGMSATAKLKA